MARRKTSFFKELAKAQRENEKRAKAQMRARNKAVNEMERKRRERERAQEQLLKAQENAYREEVKAKEQMQKSEAKAQEHLRRQEEKAAKEREKEIARLYLETRLAEVEIQNADLENQIEQLNTILEATLDVDDYLDLDQLKANPIIPNLYIPSQYATPALKPQLGSYLPEVLSGVQKLVPGAKRKYQLAVDDATKRFEADLAKFNAAELERQRRVDQLKKEYLTSIDELKARTEAQHVEIDQFKNDLASGDPEAIINYCTLVLEASVYPDDFPQHAKIAYVPESKQLVIEYDLPTIDMVPESNVYKYNKSKDEITSTSRPVGQRKALYASIVAQVTIRTIHEIFEADRSQHIETIVFNGYVETIDKGTGRDMRICLVTVRTTRDVFMQIDLSRVDPEMCLKTLNASVSKSPSELAPVRPVLEFNMVDPRFVEETDVISTLDQRPNLMELSPSEFESLITNLFVKMGLEARQTQASRDGGVDCVAYDPRPIFGGKVIIQAKRYKHTVGVSAVRDLFGTLQNEGASKGILVTTSGYGKAAYEFAEGKPLELLSGSHLLHLLKEYADIDAKIVVPDHWKDAVLDAPEV